MEILRRTEEVIAEALADGGLRASDLAAIGITNQREAIIVSTASGDLLLGNVDTFLLSNLTGGAKGGVRITKLTNASRTQLLQH